MKKRYGLGKRIAAACLSALLTVSFVGESCVDSVAPVWTAVAYAADQNASGTDGYQIDNITARWVTSDSDTDCQGNAVSAAEKGDDTHLFLATTSADPISMQYQVEVTFSGQQDYAPGSITLRIPAQVIHGRTYDENGAGVTDPDVYIDSLTLPVPQAPSTKADFNWQLVDGEYVLTNTSTVGASSTVTFQFTIENLNPVDVVDRSESDPIQAVCQVVTGDGSTVSRTSNAITAQMDTRAIVKSVYKNDDTLYDGLHEDVPQELLANLPAGADPADYIYVSWYSYVYHEGNQPFSLKAEEVSTAAYQLNEGSRGSKLCDGIFLGYKNIEADEGGSLSQAVLLENEYCNDTTEPYDHTVYCWTAYPPQPLHLRQGQRRGRGL